MFVKSSLFVALLLCAIKSNGQLFENFNSRPGIASTQVRGYLQSRCWNLVNFDSGLPESRLEGDGALVSKPAADSRIRTGIYSPLLDGSKVARIRFQYRSIARPAGNADDYLKIILASANNDPLLILDSIKLNSLKSSSYDRVFTQIPQGVYRLFLSYSNKPGGRIAIDQLSTNLSFHYAGGCNSAPVATDDVVTADANGTVTANLVLNDKDADNDQYSIHIESAPDGGTYTVRPDNMFTFKPSENFKGRSAKFTYRICEDQTGGLCSEPATVTMNFPTSLNQSSLVDISGEYLQNGRINVSWTRKLNSAVRQYAVERSFDGREWTMACTVDATQASVNQKGFAFTDALNKNTVIKNDIYYRIREQMKGQEDIISKLLVVRVYNTQAVRMVSVTPNPVHNDLNVTLQLNHDAMTSMKITGNNGIEVLRKVMKVSSGLNSIVLEGTSSLTAGLYVLDVIINSKERMLIDLVKQ